MWDLLLDFLCKLWKNVVKFCVLFLEFGNDFFVFGLFRNDGLDEVLGFSDSTIERSDVLDENIALMNEIFDFLGLSGNDIFEQFCGFLNRVDVWLGWLFLVELLLCL